MPVGDRPSGGSGSRYPNVTASWLAEPVETLDRCNWNGCDLRGEGFRDGHWLCTRHQELFDLVEICESGFVVGAAFGLISALDW